MRRFIKYGFLLLIVSIFILCERDNLITDPNAKLSFSHDTILFDTVFTTIGSTTKQLKVYNRHTRDIEIASVYMAGGDQSNFRLNIDGLSSYHAENILIRESDSIFIFVEVTIDPVAQNNPLVVQDSIVFITNGNVQDIDLVAWGQDVHLINSEIIKTQTWTNDKPYLIYNSMLVDTPETLTINEGTRIYFHRNSTLYVSGTLIVSGTLEEPVTFQGDRLESMYEYIPGQWGGMYFINGSQNNRIDYAEIKNAVTGIHLGNLYSEDAPPTLELSNTIITHMNYAGVSSIGATISAYNCVVSDCGFYCAVLTTGGRYDFNHCTFANYWGYSNRITPSVIITNFYNLNDTLFRGQLVNAGFGNCIIYGDKMTEIGFDFLEGVGDYNYKFDFCLLKVDTSKLDISNSEYFNNIFVNTNPGFFSYNDFNFQLDTLSYAKDKGSIETAVKFPLDIFQQSRIEDAGPDLGAYERIE
ncbi:hypothetical protein ES708_04745 [subsurface metagenome]